MECGCKCIYVCIAHIVTKQQHIQIWMWTKTNERTACLSKVNITMCRIFHRNQYPSGVVSRRHWSVVACMLTHEYAIATIVIKQQHIRIRICTKTNKRTRCSSKVNITMSRTSVQPKSTSIRSREPTPLECSFIYNGMRVYKLECGCIYIGTRMCDWNYRNQATTYPNSNVPQNK